METGLTVKNLQHHSWALMVQVCFVNKDSSKSEGKFPIYGLGIPHFRKETYC